MGDYFTHVAIHWISSNLGVHVTDRDTAESLIQQHYPGGWATFQAHLVEGFKS